MSKHANLSDAAEHLLDEFPTFVWETDAHSRFQWWDDRYFSGEEGWVSPQPGQPLAEWVGPTAWNESLRASWSSSVKRGPSPIRFDAHQHRFQGWARPLKGRTGRTRGIRAVTVVIPWLPSVDSDSDIDATSFEPSLSPVVWHRIAKLTADYVLLLDRDAKIRALHHQKSGDLSLRFAGKTIYQVTAQESHDALQAAIERVFQSGVTEIVPIIIESGSGDRRVLEGRLSTLAEFDETSCIVLAAIDTTRWRNLSPGLTREEQALRQLLEIQDRERRLVAYEIHDGLIQDVIAGQMLVSTVCSSPDLPATLRDQLAEADSALQEVLREGRRLISDLRPMVIDETGLVESIQYLRHEFESRFPGVTLETDLQVQFERLEPLLEGTLFRVVKEALLNALTHGEATHVRVRLLQVGTRCLLLEVLDNGKGFQVDQIQPKRFGIDGIRDRAKAFQGGCSLETAPDQGTRLTVRVPLSAGRGARALY